MCDARVSVRGSSRENAPCVWYGLACVRVCARTTCMVHCMCASVCARTICGVDSRVRLCVLGASKRKPCMCVCCTRTVRKRVCASLVRVCVCVCACVFVCVRSFVCVCARAYHKGTAHVPKQSFVPIQIACHLFGGLKHGCCDPIPDSGPSRPLLAHGVRVFSI